MPVLNIVTKLDAGFWLPERESNNACLYNTWIKKVWIIASTIILQSLRGRNLGLGKGKC
jgi:hypothetical protein